MRKPGLALLIAVTVSLPVVAYADRLVTKLRVSVETFSIRKIDAATPTRVVFTDAPVKGEVALVAALLPSPTKATDAMPLPDSEWWKQLVWDVKREGEPVPFRPRWSSDAGVSRAAHANADGVARLNAGDRLIAKFDAGVLPAGIYRLTARLGELRSEPEWFLISTGKENADLRREFARYKVDRSPDKQSLKENLLELAAADPLNAGPWIRLGDLTLGDGSADEIRSYYDRAVDTLERRRKSFVAEGRQDVVRAIEADSRMLIAVRDIIPNYVANRSTQILHADVQAGRRYILRERSTGRVLRTFRPQHEAP